MLSKASAVWRGSLKSGAGIISSASGALHELPYSFKTRFEGEKGSNPEELIAAAHSACFSMALSAELGKVGVTPDEIVTSATVVLSQSEGGFTITESNLVATVRAAGSPTEVLEKAAATAKENCPVSKLLKAKISLNLTVEV